MHNFDQNMIIPALTGEKLDRIWRKNIPITYLSKMRQSLSKNLLLVSDKLQIRHTGKLTYAKKENSNITFLSGARNIVKMGSEISKYFSWFFQSAKYLMLFWGWCSTRPHYFIHILPPDCLNCNWLFVNLAAAPDCVQLVPKYFSKVKLCSWQSPNISVWNNYTAIKWVRWWGSGLNL